MARWNKLRDTTGVHLSINLTAQRCSVVGIFKFGHFATCFTSNLELISHSTFFGIIYNSCWYIHEPSDILNYVVLESAS